MFSILVLVMFGCGIPQTRKYQQSTAYRSI